VTVDGQIYAQPFYVPSLSIGGGTHNVVFIGTMHDSLYAIDADTGAVYWHNTYGTYVNVPDTSQGTNTNDISPVAGIGIESTPVIDPSTNTIYFVTQNEPSSGTFTEYLNAANISTGAAVFGSPKLITGTYTTADGTLTFVNKNQNQRPSLTLANGDIYIAWSSHSDNGVYEGWIMSYSASNLAQLATYADTSTSGGQGGIWQAGQGFSVDSSGNLYVSTGNGNFGASAHGVTQTGESFVKLSSSLALLDYFTPYNAATLDSGDQDLGSSGTLLIPGTTYLTGGGKAGVLYLVNTATGSMGEFNSSSDHVVQEFQAVFGTGTSHIHGAPIYFNSSTNGPLIYVWGENDYLRCFKFTNNLYNTTPFAMSSMTAPEFNANGAMPGGFMCVSANGGTNGIVWAVTPFDANANGGTVEGIFHAFSADTLTELWNDQQDAARDEMGEFAKFNTPIEDNGKVYLPTFGPLGSPDGSGALNVYGLLSATTYLAYNLTYTSSGASTSLQTDTTFNPSTWVELAATGTGQSVTYTIPSIAAGTYQLQMQWKGNTNRGQLSLSVDGGAALTPTSLDQYAATQTYPITTFTPNLTFSTTGTHTIKLTVTGKNASSSGYYLSAYSFILTP
jgi:hypothetical protein